MAEPLPNRRWTLRSAARRFAQIARNEGPRSLWFKVWGELGYRRRAVYVLTPQDAVPEARPPKGGAVDLRPLSPGDVADYARLRPGTNPGEVERRRALGHDCYVARRGGELVFSAWVARGRLHSDPRGVAVDLRPHQVATYEVYTAPHVRCQGIGTAARAQLVRLLRAEAEATTLLSFVDPENREGIRLLERLGYRRRGTVAGVGIGRRRVTVRGLGRLDSPPT